MAMGDGLPLFQVRPKLHVPWLGLLSLGRLLLGILDRCSKLAAEAYQELVHFASTERHQSDFGLRVWV